MREIFDRLGKQPAFDGIHDERRNKCRYHAVSIGPIDYHCGQCRQVAGYTRRQAAGYRTPTLG
jgi:hypothetical protein